MVENAMEAVRLKGARESLAGTWSRLRRGRLEWRATEYGGPRSCESGECAHFAAA